MKVFIYSFLALSFFVVKAEEQDVIPQGTLTIQNRSKNGCYVWFACYTKKSGAAKKRWYPDYDPIKKTVKPLILYPNQGAQVSIPDDECFYSFFGWWGSMFKKVEKRVAKEHRCRNITVTFRGDKELVASYDIELTEKEKEEIAKKEKEEAEKKEADAKAAAEGVPAAPTTPQPAPQQKKGYWV